MKRKYITIECSKCYEIMYPIQHLKQTEKNCKKYICYCCGKIKII